MVYVAPLGIAGSYRALGFCILISLFKNFEVFVYDASREEGLRSFD